MSRDRIKLLKFLFTIPLAMYVYYMYTNDTSFKIAHEKAQKVFETYPSITHNKKDYHGIVKYISIGHKGVAGRSIYIDLSTGERFSIYGGTTYNSKYKKGDLEVNIHVGDSLYFNYKTLDLYIYRKSESLYFKVFSKI